jgi:hypothetical protein
VETNFGRPENYFRVTGDSECMGQDGTPVEAGQKSCWRRCAARERCLRSDLREARFRWLTMLDLSRYEFNERPR